MSRGPRIDYRQPGLFDQRPAHRPTPIPTPIPTPTPTPTPYAEVGDQAQINDETRTVLSARLSGLLRALGDGRWYTVGELALRFECPEPSISAQIRDLRKPKYGGHDIEGRRDDDGQFRYRLRQT